MRRGTSTAQQIAAETAADDRFWSRTQTQGDCRVWTGYRDRQGYGTLLRTSISSSPILAHRYAYLLTHGSIPAGAVIRHTCDNPPCVEPTHLLIGTQADNIADRQARGRHRPGRLHGIDHPGHKLDEQSVRTIRNAYRTGWYTQQEIADLYRVHVSTVQRIVSGRNWRHLDAA